VPAVQLFVREKVTTTMNIPDRLVRIPVRFRCAQNRIQDCNPNMKGTKGSNGTETSVHVAETAEGGRLTEDKKARGMDVLCPFQV
jgi:hypothetical protein